MIQRTNKILANIQNNSYNIYIGSNKLFNGGFDYLFKDIGKVVIVTNSTVYTLYKHFFRKLNFNYQLILLPDGEKYKTWFFINKIYEKLIVQRFSRNSTIIAIGGGVIGDMAGFVASTYQRGINLIHIPTTLIGQVDSSIGGKTGYNHRHAKNLIGTFYQPKMVVIDTKFLLTLSERHLLSGIAEIIKYSLIGRVLKFDWLEKKISELKAYNLKILNKAIISCCKYKVEIITQDEKDKNVRMFLNFGHTFGHAIEAATKYNKYTHGEAIAIGMLIAAFISKKMSLLSIEKYELVKKIIYDSELPTYIPKNISSNKILSHIKYDKKNFKDGEIRMVLLKDIGEPYICEKLNFNQIEKLFIKFRALG